MSASERKVLRDYYVEKDYISSPDGVLKVLSVIAYIVAGACAFALSSGGAGAPLVGGSAGGAWLVCSALLCVLACAALLGLPARAPLLWLYTDAVGSSVAGVAGALAVLLAALLCRSTPAALRYVYLCVGGVAATLAVGSAVWGYAGAMRRVDAHHARARAPHDHAPAPAPPRDVDV